jgi:hypothetical protein
MMKLSLKIGVPIAFGTDSAVSPHGMNAKEFSLLVELGMTPEAARRRRDNGSTSTAWAGGSCCLPHFSVESSACPIDENGPAHPASTSFKLAGRTSEVIGTVERRLKCASR